MTTKKKAKKRAAKKKKRSTPPKVKFKLSLIGDDIEAQYAPISKKQFDLLATDSEEATELWEELDDSLSAGNGAFEESGFIPGPITVYVDDVEHGSATARINKQTKARIKKPALQKYGADDYFVVRTQTNSEAIYELSIREHFDPKKLEVHTQCDRLPDDSLLEIARISYDGEGLSLQSGEPRTVEICAVHPKSGKCVHP
jgi:hypothetical protein